MITMSTGCMEASSNPRPTLVAARTVYPKVSRNDFSHCSTSSSLSMQRTTDPGIRGKPEKDMVHLKQPIVTIRSSESCSKVLTLHITLNGVRDTQGRFHGSCCILVPGDCAWNREARRSHMREYPSCLRAHSQVIHSAQYPEGK